MIKCGISVPMKGMHRIHTSHEIIALHKIKKSYYS